VITREWWKSERGKYTLLISEAVEAECERGDPKAAELQRELLEEVSLFPVDERILELARLLVVPGAIPEKAGPNAVHIAAAAVVECDFLSGNSRHNATGRVREFRLSIQTPPRPVPLTWNFRHIANVRIRRNVERILGSRGYTKTHTRRACLTRSRRKTRCFGRCTQHVTHMPRSTAMIWIGSMRT
jgi:hypothetical protein